jgi:hypothetical protein
VQVLRFRLAGLPEDRANAIDDGGPDVQAGPVHDLRGQPAIDLLGMMSVWEGRFWPVPMDWARAFWPDITKTATSAASRGGTLVHRAELIWGLAFPLPRLAQQTAGQTPFICRVQYEATWQAQLLRGAQQLWNGKQALPQPRVDESPLVHAPGSVLAVSPDNTWFATSDSDCAVELRNMVSGEILFRLNGHTREVTSLAVSKDGAHLISGSFDGTLKVWKLPEGALLRTLAAHNKGVTAVAVSPDGRLVASGGSDDLDGPEPLVRLWSLDDGRLVRKLGDGIARPVTHLEFIPPGNLLMGVEYFGTHVWDTTTGSRKHWVPDAWVARAMASGVIAYARRGAVVIFSLETETRLGDLTPDMKADIRALAVSADGNLVAWSWEKQDRKSVV